MNHGGLAGIIGQYSAKLSHAEQAKAQTSSTLFTEDGIYKTFMPVLISALGLRRWRTP